jgi:hypothetical protein
VAVVAVVGVVLVDAVVLAFMPGTMPSFVGRVSHQRRNSALRERNARHRP